MEQRYDEHYIRSITQMGDTQNVVTSQAIFTTRKIKLIEKGVRVNSALFERLVRGSGRLLQFRRVRRLVAWLA